MISDFFVKKAAKARKTSSGNKCLSIQASSSDSIAVVTNIVPATKRQKKTHEKSDVSSSFPDEVLQLIESLMEPSWKQALLDSGTLATTRFAALARFVQHERHTHTIFPPPANVWNALNSTSLENIKVVIVGQDPYHGAGQAHGLCFSVRPGQAVPPSLKNIYQELASDDDLQPQFRSGRSYPHGHLQRWAQQGVLMLNTVLTVRQGAPQSHQNKGWEHVTDAILRLAAAQQRPLIFLLWGKPAQAKAPTSPLGRHVVICTSHPSPLGARKTSAPFMGSRCFSRCNQALQDLGQAPIDWNIDGPLP